MKISYRKSLLAGAIAVLVATPGWAGSDASKTHDRMPQAEGTQSPHPGMDTSRANPGGVVYTMSPRELRGKDVIGPGGEEIGSVKAVVHSRHEKDIQAVISAGGFLGVGDKAITVPLNQLQYVNGELRINASEEELKARPEYQPEQYVELEPGDQPISEFSAFELEESSRDAAPRSQDQSLRWQDSERGDRSPNTDAQGELLP
ncbi:PRC-barrel domain-containing protein [Aromatoleum buckelii]|uniref:PRC-barrel domain-containing protein n=1 Tax=Aromatoleum buckelii TaxID=200254 RepID=A0ABX1N2G7_9RHOO|nr:PRC-barrel domain-containing protein [Aromatoleum buckelii]MCK0510882.1 PRC-barrel domain-containing protein [Aromatoleum buckelii]